MRYFFEKRNFQKKIDGNFDYVVNLGGEVDHSKNNKTYKSHFIGVKNISNFFIINKKISKFLQIGSSTEYMSKSPQKENDLCMPVSIYGKSSLAFSNPAFAQKHNEKKFPSLIFRLYQVYGPYQDLNRLIPIIINGCLKKQKRFNCSSGIQNRDFLYVDDLITIILKALNSKIEGQIFNVGGGKKQNIKKVILKIKKIIKKGKPIFGKIKMRKDEKINTFPSINKIKKFLNWSPKISFNKGINKTIKYYIKSSKILNN